MTISIPKSLVPDPVAFENAVKEHIARLVAFNFQKGKPRPIAPHPYVEQAIKRVQTKGKPDNYHPDYEIFDDTPRLSLENEFEQKRQELFAAVNIAEVAAKSKILPQGKQRFVTLEYTIATGKPVDEQTDDDKSKIESFKVYQAAFLKIELVAAAAHASIEDLTPATIDSWKVPTFE